MVGSFKMLPYLVLSYRFGQVSYPKMSSLAYHFLASGPSWRRIGAELAVRIRPNRPGLGPEGLARATRGPAIGHGRPPARCARSIISLLVFSLYSDRFDAQYIVARNTRCTRTE